MELTPYQMILNTEISLFCFFWRQRHEQAEAPAGLAVRRGLVRWDACMAHLGSGDVPWQQVPLHREDLTNATSLRIPFSLRSFPHTRWWQLGKCFMPWISSLYIRAYFILNDTSIWSSGFFLTDIFKWILTWGVFRSTPLEHTYLPLNTVNFTINYTVDEMVL